MKMKKKQEYLIWRYVQMDPSAIYLVYDNCQ
jgi:hypothetical protein